MNQAKQRMTEAQRDYEDRRAKLAAIDEQIRSLEKVDNEIRVTEHAYLRWFERALGFDLEEVRRQMLTERTDAMINAMKTCRVKMGTGLTLVVKDKTIISIVED